MARLETLLKEAFAIAPIDFRKDHIAVLNLACGRADETGVLATVINPTKIGFYLGMDLRAEAIAEAKKRWLPMHGEIDFREGNAAMLGRIEGLPKFDLVFIRHQNYWHQPLVWEGIIDEAIAAMAPGGKLVCTSYFDREHELLLASLRARHVRILANLRHALSRPLPDAPQKSVDRWILVADAGPLSESPLHFPPG